MTGEVLWSQHYASPEGVDEGALGMVLDNQNNVILTGYAMIGAEGKQAMTMKLSGANGSILWTDTFGGSDNNHDIAWDIVMGSDNNPVISGVIVESGEVANYFVRKMNNSDGEVIWDKRGPEAQFTPDNRGTWLVLMDNDDVVMCQRTFGPNAYDVYLHRFAADDGSPVWTRTYDSDTHGGDDPKAMIVDSQDNLLICGVQDANWNYNYMVLKIDGSNGDTIWNADYDGPPGWYDVASNIVEGPNGKVIVSGLSDGIGTGWDWATIAYDGSNGSQVWEKRFDGPPSESDEASHMVANAAGEVFVTGYGYGFDTNKDMFTICYMVETTSAVGETPLVANFSKAWPNPFNPRVNFSFDLPADAATRLAIYDLRGREVTILVDSQLSEGSHTTTWDGRNRQGHAMPAGVYLAIMESGQIRSSQKIVLAK